MRQRAARCGGSLRCSDCGGLTVPGGFASVIDIKKLDPDGYHFALV
jgi:hypothetical protein